MEEVSMVNMGTTYAMGEHEDEDNNSEYGHEHERGGWMH